ncbi:Hsp20/alpha crystallin family protein [Patescibacteria group bacterium]|nr:Hsp20/alpha crystallin family protein [Patescibacteria group bacterium]
MKNELQNRDDHNQPHSRRDEFANPLSLIDKFFEASSEPFSLMPPSLLRNRGFGTVSSIFPKVDVEETDQEIRVVANVPGIDAQNIIVEVGDDYLSLSGTIDKETKDEKKGKVYRYERENGEFRREFALPARVNKNEIVARSKNGVLTITLPKSEEEQKKRVKIQVE